MEELKSTTLGFCKSFSQQGKQRKKKQQMERKTKQIHIVFVWVSVWHTKRDREWPLLMDSRGQVHSPLTSWNHRNI